MDDRLAVMKGNLDLLVLKALIWGPRHGFEILEWLEQQSGGRLEIDDSAIYQALHRMEARDLVRGTWGVSDSNRRVRFYTLADAGRAELRSQTARWTAYSKAVDGILRARRSE
jgi:PadR family transcriptional regulator, regulatory protein PadR